MNSSYPNLVRGFLTNYRSTDDGDSSPDETINSSNIDDKSALEQGNLSAKLANINNSPKLLGGSDDFGEQGSPHQDNSTLAIATRTSSITIANVDGNDLPPVTQAGSPSSDSWTSFGHGSPSSPAASDLDGYTSGRDEEEPAPPSSSPEPRTLNPALGSRHDPDFSIFHKGFADKVADMGKLTNYRDTKISFLEDQRSGFVHTYNRLGAELQEVTTNIRAIDRKLDKNHRKDGRRRDEELVFIKSMKRKMHFASDWLNEEERKRTKSNRRGAADRASRFHL